MKFSILPPTSGTRTSTVALNSSREPLSDFAAANNAAPVKVAGAPRIEPLTVAVDCPSRIGAPRLFADETQVAAVELGHHAGQPVNAQRLRRDNVDAVRVDGHRIQRVVVGARIGQPRQPILFVAECPMNLFDAAAVFGGHVE